MTRKVKLEIVVEIEHSDEFIELTDEQIEEFVQEVDYNIYFNENNAGNLENFNDGDCIRVVGTEIRDFEIIKPKYF